MAVIFGMGKISNVKCTQIALPEFPNLLFGTYFDGRTIFDATNYLTHKDPEHKLSVEDFFAKFSFQIKSIAQAYSIPMESLVIINRDGHQLIDGSLCYPFISYVDPNFCAYMNEVVDELFTTGVVISDTHLVSLVRKRFSQELLKQILDGE